MTITEQERRAKWAEKQIRALLDVGLDLVDAEAIVRQTLENTPEGEDLDTYVPPEDGLQDGAQITPDDIARARAAWYADPAIPPAFKMLLDAREATE